MDHNYRAAQQGSKNGNGNGRFRPGGRGPALPKQYQANELEPLPVPQADDAPRIFAFVEDLFFQAKIQETARKLNVKVEFVRNGDNGDVLDRFRQNGDSKPSLIIFDLNNQNAKPLSMIPKLRKELKKQTAIIGFVSHVQGDLKMKAQEAGCDMVVPRSAFSQNLPQLLRRHGAADEPEQTIQ